MTTLALVIQRRVHGGDRLTGVRQYRAEPAEQLDKLVALAPLPECPPVVARCDGQLIDEEEPGGNPPERRAGRALTTVRAARKPRVVPRRGLYPLTSVAAATSVYRFVNDQGVTEYAAEPPRDGRHYQIMAVDSPLSAAQAASAERQREALLRAAARSDRVHAEAHKAREESIGAARARLASATHALRAAQATGDSDWQRLANGKRHLKQAFFDRVASAKEDVRSAEAALLGARQARH